MIPINRLGAAPDEFKLSLGEVCIRWSEVEHMIVLLFCGVMRIHYAAGKHALHNATNINMRLNMVRNAIEEFPPHKDGFLEDFDKQGTELRKLASRRAKFVHGRWVTMANGEVRLLRPSGKQGDAKADRVVRISELAHLSASIDRLYREFAALTNEVRPIPELPDELKSRQSISS
ncbi:MAG: hypothetical protein JXQ85_05160 [Cognatishimia sp.]|uniref:hypothetical protein n=1 Tax=Cognatishimia sp. TaxID=2211648 RepID=UPI003B8CA0A7